jgi:2,3-diketo-5-methylthio-1-phosphopentane phosphatase
MSFAIFSDFDGTLTDRDTIDLVVESFLGCEYKQSLSQRLHAGTMSIREALSEEFALLHTSPDEIREFICQNIRLDAHLGELIRLARARAYPFTILSSGMDLLILPLLEASDAAVEVRCNRLLWNGSSARISEEESRRVGEKEKNAAQFPDSAQVGRRAARKTFTIEFIDESANGHDKALALRAAKQTGRRVIYIGDGLSDIACAREADVLFARRTLERYCREHGIPHYPFSGCADVIRYLEQNT